MRCVNIFGGSTPRNCMGVMTPMQRCKDISKSGKGKHVLPLLLILACFLVLPCQAYHFQSLEDGSDRVVDLDTGDIYFWDDELALYVKEEPEKEVEVETEYVGVQLDSDNTELPDNPVTLEDLEALIAPLSNYDQSSQYPVGTQNISIFSGLVSKVPWGQHYVYWRDGQYSYRFAYGDIELTGTTFKGDVTIVTYSQPGGSGSYYTWNTVKDSSFTLSAGNRLVYSDLGDYPGLSDREVLKNVEALLLVVTGSCLFALFERLRRSCFRR